ncbi:Imidazole glycerol phosphate synthase [Desulfonema limicola]|uniref:Imidazole glycerol phosphate synthase subunit HisH n=1 Tax=Desulfonema limicola TaxID=45656 RepID=A0A975B4Z0_9BACT|nr:imidazole glycerol phosphate synthase subunit HisH [Desulfonema limicola]QTA78893.1 Imidazole glycerol phosphate synthase [Desulfonema limicola]
MIAIIDYDAGNLTSVARAITFLGYECVVTNDVEKIKNAKRVIFPGVGAAGSAMASLKRLKLDVAIKDAFGSGKPVLGICLGTQIIMGHSDEDRGTSCLGIIEGNVPEFSTDMKAEDKSPLKIPHMGWNSIRIKQEHPVLKGIGSQDEFYFVHSFYPCPDKVEHVIGETQYGITFASVMGFKNIIATQFHPEKSGRPGLALLKNFCEWTPC